MLAFRTEIRNSPTEQTIKIFLKDIAQNAKVKQRLEAMGDIKLVEIRQSVERNRVSEHLTVFRKKGVDINELQGTLKIYLKKYFRTK